MQTSQAFVADFQRSLVDLSEEQNLAEHAINFLRNKINPLYFFEASDKELVCEISLKTDSAEDLRQEVRIPLPASRYPGELQKNEALKDTLQQILNIEIHLQPIYFLEKTLGIWVCAKQFQSIEWLPQAAQIFAFVSQARYAGQGPRPKVNSKSRVSQASSAALKAREIMEKSQ
jgi:hypothetical protein